MSVLVVGSVALDSVENKHPEHVSIGVDIEASFFTSAASAGRIAFMLVSARAA